MKHYLKLLTGPFAFVLAFAVFGTPSAPGATVAPTVGGVAHAYVGHCGRAYAYQGHEQARRALGCPGSTILTGMTFAAAYTPA